MKLFFCLLFVLAGCACTSAADSVWLTVYDGNYAVVRDVRAFDLPKGESEIRFADISPLILDEPVRAKGNGLRVLEQNFQYHRLNDEFLLSQSLGKKVEFLMRSGDTLSGVLLGREGSDRDTTSRLVIQQGGGAIRTLRWGDVKDYRYPTAPLEFSIKPALTFKVETAAAGSHDIEAAYQVQGLDWGAHYLLDLSGNDTTAILSGWAVVVNATGRGYDHARLTLVTGQAPYGNRALRIATDERMSASTVRSMLSQQPGFKVDPAGGLHVRGGRESEMMVKVDGTDFRDPLVSSEHQQLYNLQFYTLPRETSLPDGAEKEFILFAPATIKTVTRYEYTPWKNESKVGVYVSTQNSDSVGLGTPLPAGPVKIYRTRSGGIAEDVGEDRLGAVAVNEPVRFRVGYAEGLSVQRKSLKSETSWRHKTETQWEVRIRNDRDAEAQVVLQDQFPERWKILDSSEPYQKTGEHSIEIPVRVPADSEAVVTYTVQMWRAWK